MTTMMRKNDRSLHRRSLLLLLVLLLLVVTRIVESSTSHNEKSNKNQQYTIVGVSGGLQLGFPDHKNLDYNGKNVYGEDVVVEAVFLGRALIRGYKSYLDVMEPSHRQYIAPASGEQPLINCNVMPTGCWHHANEYWLYLVDTRQAFSILMHEPRFLSITPDHGLVDLEAEETSPVVKHIAQHEIQKQNKTDFSAVAFPIVTGVWFNPTSHVPSPILYTKKDGTQVTNFPQSLMKWAGVEPQVDTQTCHADVEAYIYEEASTPREIRDFWTAITKSIRHAEANRPSSSSSVEQAMSHAPSSYDKCERKVRFGTSPQQARINYPFDPDEFQQVLRKGGFHIDYDKAKVSAIAKK